MRRASKTRSKKSGGNSDSEGEVNNSAQIDNAETESTNEVDTSSSSGKKRNVRGQVKTSNENQSDNEEEGSDNEASPSKRKKKASSEIPENGKGESDEEAEKSVNKKKKTKQSKNDENDEEIPKEVEQNGKSSGKGKKKGKASQKKEEKHDDDEEEEEEYEVEKIVDQRTIKGRRQFLVRWKGYSGESDTWENEKDLNCDRLIEEFLTEQEENESVDEEKKEKNEKKSKSKKQVKNSKNQKKTKKSESKVDKNDDDDDQDNENAKSAKEYEVARIIEVYFKKDKTREFLIRWKGFSSKEDTWEPEEHLNCPELINKFMEKVEKQKGSDSRELRMNPSHTKRYTLTMHADKRQSRRNAAKQRVTYYECDA